MGAGGKLIVSLDGSLTDMGRVDKALLRAIVRANHWRELLESGKAENPYDLARHESCRVSYVQRHLPLAFLSPDLVEAIVNGKQPPWCALSALVKRPNGHSWSSYSATYPK